MFNKITENVEIHQTLPDTPNMTTQELKKEWDKGNKIIKEAFNTCVDELNKKVEFNGIKEKNGYIKLPSGLKIFWGQVASTDFFNDSESTKYKYEVQLPAECTIFLNAFTTFQYSIGSSFVGIKKATLTSVTLYSEVKVAGFMVNWFAIGI